jgi:hypothetical protein
MGRGGRLAAAALAVGLALSLAGDGGRAATVPAVIQGQDPLEVLSLKVRPNVIIVLDSSGSMTSRVPGGNTGTGDHPRSRLYQAKEVLRNFVAQNDDKASFMYGSYAQVGSQMYNLTAGDDRFQYYTSSDLSPSMLTNEITIQRARNDTNDRGFQAWQWIDTQWNTLWFDTGGADCSASVPAGFYQTGDDLAQALQTAMRATPCGSDFNVGYQEWDGRFTFGRSSGGTLDIHWGNGGANNIAEALGGRGGNDLISDYPITLLRREGFGNSGWINFQFSENIDGSTVQFYQVKAGRLWNGETLQVQADGTICDIDFGDATTRTSPPSFTVQVVSNNCGAPSGQTEVFTYAGADFGGNSRSCRGYMPKVGIVPCDLAPPPTQIETIGPYIDLELPFNPDGTAQNYTEVMDGSWATDVAPLDTQGGAKADGFTPIANSLIDIKGAPGGTCLDVTDSDGDGVTNELVTCPQRNFTQWWELGPNLSDPTTNPAWAAVTPPTQRAIKNHLDPKEKTIVLFVTDGDDTCGAIQNGGSGGTDDNAKRAAYWAERLYERIDPLEPASSVQTYVIGFGGAFTAGEPTRLNWIAWGGSGLGQGLPGQPDVPTSGDHWSGDNTSFKNLRAQCTTCEDAFVAPDAATLAVQLQSIIDQGASSGEFTAQQSITESVYEYVDVAGFDARSPTERYKGIVPTRFISSFTLPGFRGQLKAYQNAGDIDGDGVDDVVQRWSAGDELFNLVSGGMNAVCDSSVVGGGLGECVFTELHGGATDATIAGSPNAAIKRRIYTTDRNGVYTFSPASLMAQTASNRVALWPPDPGVAPADYTSMGQFDEAMGLPDNAPTCTLNGFPSCEEQLFAEMQAAFGACVGPNLPGGCTAASASVRMQAARREARDIILAFMAGAETVPAAPNGISRTSGSYGGSPASSLLFKARSWMLADSEFATAAVVTPPLEAEPEATGTWVDEYQLFRDGVRDGSSGQILQGFGLRSPDDDGTAGAGNDTRTALKPVMTVLYAPGNDMLHAFRAGPNVSPSSSCSDLTDECGGEELWGFVPYDQLEALRLRVINDPQGRENHVYMIARGVRFADVFVPTPSASPMTNVSIGSVTVPEMEGVWRRILFFGRGIGGKYVTALDVTAPGPYTADALETAGPIPLWSRGNPDTEDGTAAGPNNNTAADRVAYAGMGETWSMPAVAFVESTNPIYETARSSPDRVKYVLAMGSGYGETSTEGSTFYTLDALSGDVIAAVDVEAAAAGIGWTRSGLPYDNALVANAVGFNPRAFTILQSVHPAAASVTRYYIGDIHGRFWKFLTADPTVAIPVADVGEDQPIGTSASVLGMPPYPDTPVPYVFVSSGNDTRVEDGPFRNFAFEDGGTDTQVTVGASSTSDGVEVYNPVSLLFALDFAQGDPEAECGYTAEAWFRGTVQPATAFECPAGATGVTTCTPLLGRVFLAGTRLSEPNTRYAPPTPYACGGPFYPCRSQFDSIIYALGATTGLAAYDMNATGDDAYRIFRDSRLVALGMQGDPDPSRSGSSFTADEGLVKSVPKPPPPPGVPPQTTQATASVTMAREPGEPPPSVYYGSTVCQ